MNSRVGKALAGGNCCGLVEGLNAERLGVWAKRGQQLNRLSLCEAALAKSDVKPLTAVANVRWFLQ